MSRIAIVCLIYSLSWLSTAAKVFIESWPNRRRATSGAIACTLVGSELAFCIFDAHLKFKAKKKEKQTIESDDEAHRSLHDDDSLSDTKREKKPFLSKSPDLSSPRGDNKSASNTQITLCGLAMTAMGCMMSVVAYQA